MADEDSGPGDPLPSVPAPTRAENPPDLAGPSAEPGEPTEAGRAEEPASTEPAAQLTTAQAAQTPQRTVIALTTQPASSRSRRLDPRSLVAGVCLVLGSVLIVPAVFSQWAAHTIADNGNFVQTMQPLSSDPQVRDAVATHVGREVTASLGLGEVLGNALQQAVTAAVNGLLSTDTFQNVWTAASSEAQRALVSGLRSDGGIDAAGETVVLDLSGGLEQIRVGLVAGGLTVAETADVPDLQIELPLFRPQTVRNAQFAFRYLEPAAPWLPWAAGGLLLGALAFARRRPRMLALVGVVLAGSALTVSALISIGGTQFVDSLANTPLAIVGGPIYAQLLSSLSRYWPWQLMGGVGLVVLGVSWSLIATRLVARRAS